MCYVDDIIIYSKTFDDHLVHLDSVINKLTKTGFTINSKKCIFCMHEINDLGHIVSKPKLGPTATEISKVCRIYCSTNHKKWAELTPHIDHWLNNSVASTTSYNPVKSMFVAKKTNFLGHYCQSY